MADAPLQQVQEVKPLPIFDTEDRRPLQTAGTFLGQKYINGWPELSKNPTSYYEKTVDFKKRPGLRLSGTALSPTIASYGATTDVCLANMAMTSVSDVCVAAFWHAATTKIFIIQYRPVAGTTVLIGTLSGATSGDFVFFTEALQNSGGTYPAGTLGPAVLISYMKADRSVGAGYYATTTSGVFTTASLTTISSGSFPSNLGTPKVITGPFQQMNGVTYIMTLEGTIYASGGSGGTLYDSTIWNTNAITVASMAPDNGVGVYRYKNTIVAAGTTSMEFFTDAALPPPGSPLERLEQAYIDFGLLSPKLLLNIDDTIYWVATSKTSTLGVWKLDGYQPSITASPLIRDILSFSFPAMPTNIQSMEQIVVLGKKHIAINGMNTLTAAFYASPTTALTETFPISTNDTSSVITCYNIEDNVWWGLATGGRGTAWYISVANNSSIQSGSPWTQYIFRTTAVGVATFSPTKPCLWTTTGSSQTVMFMDDYADGSGDDPVCVVIQTNSVWFNTEKRKRISRLVLIAEQLVQAPSDTNNYIFYMIPLMDSPNLTSSTILVDLEAKTRSISVPTETSVPNRSRIMFNNLGIMRQFGVCLVNKMNSTLEVRAVEVHATQCTS